MTIRTWFGMVAVTALVVACGDGGDGSPWPACPGHVSFEPVDLQTPAPVELVDGDGPWILANARTHPELDVRWRRASRLTVERVPLQIEQDVYPGVLPDDMDAMAGELSIVDLDEGHVLLSVRSHGHWWGHEQFAIELQRVDEAYDVVGVGVRWHSDMATGEDRWCDDVAGTITLDDAWRPRALTFRLQVGEGRGTWLEGEGAVHFDLRDAMPEPRGRWREYVAAVEVRQDTPRRR